MASSAAAAMSGAMDSAGPVKPSKTPIFTSAAMAGVATSADAMAAISNFFIMSSNREESTKA